MTRTITNARTVVFAGETLFVADELGLLRENERFCELKYGATVLATSPDGRVLYADEMKKIIAFDVESGEELTRWTSTGENPMTIAPSPDGQKLVFVGGDEGGTVGCHVLGQKKGKRAYGLRYGQIRWLDAERFVAAYRPNSKTLLAVYRFDGELILDLPPTQETLRAIAVLDGVLFAGTKRGIIRYELTEELPFTRVWEGPPVNQIEVVGRRFAVATEGGVYLVDLTGGAEQLAPDHAIAVAASGKRVVHVREGGTVVELRP
ncbi:MAG: hypothetical protein Q8Q09_11300 [Deltaproteobacteria bacterium]|nr:hypothetical protein [Deltaproteobacteria bacterium]